MSVIIPHYEDPDNLLSAVRSALSQSLLQIEVIVCDDGSRSRQAMGALVDASKLDERVSVLPSATNSGAPGAPRNRGIRSARGKYVLFLDSDDVLYPNACADLLSASDSRADLIVGQTSRVDLPFESNRKILQESIFRNGPATIFDIRECPQLMWLVVSIGKLYRRGFLNRHMIRFPEGVAFEDSVFNTAVLGNANVISVVPALVVEYRRYPATDRKTITNGTLNSDELLARVDAVARLQEESARSSPSWFRRLLWTRLLENDYRQVREVAMWLCAPDDARVLAEIGERVAGRQRDVVESLRGVDRLGYEALMQGDHSSHEQLGIYRLSKRESVGGSFHQANDLVVWSPLPDLSAVSHQIYRLRASDDIEALLALRKRPLHRVLFARSEGRDIVVLGETQDPLSSRDWHSSEGHLLGDDREGALPPIRVNFREVGAGTWRWTIRAPRTLVPRSRLVMHKPGVPQFAVYACHRIWQAAGPARAK